MKVVACMLKLERTRTAGYTLFDEATNEFQEITPRIVKDLIIQGQIKGLKLVRGGIELDEEGFNMHNLIIKSSVGKYTSLYPTKSMITTTYAVVKEIITDKGKLYIIISNKCAKFKFTYEQLKGLIEIGGYVGGARMINGEIEVCEGVSILDKRSKVEHLDNQCNIESTVVKSSIDIDC